MATLGCGTEIPLPLVTAQQQLTAEFERLDAGLRSAAGKLARDGLTGANAREALNDLCEDFAYAIDCAAVDAQGRMVTVEPSPYRHFDVPLVSGPPCC